MFNPFEAKQYHTKTHQKSCSGRNSTTLDFSQSCNVNAVIIIQLDSNIQVLTTRMVWFITTILLRFFVGFIRLFDIAVKVKNIFVNRSDVKLGIDGAYLFDVLFLKGKWTDDRFLQFREKISDFRYWNYPILVN